MKIINYFNFLKNLIIDKIKNRKYVIIDLKNNKFYNQNYRIIVYNINNL